MATKKDLTEAQGFSRRRLLSAFTGGAPGGKELEPAKPLRAVIAGVALSAMVVLGGLFFGLISPGLPDGWENNRLIVAKDTGARYLSVDGTLHPVINTVSARLLIPANEFSVVTVSQGSLSGVPIGETIGILGGPDALPSSAALEDGAWEACVADRSTQLRIGGKNPRPAASDRGLVVTREEDIFVISGGHRFAVDPAQSAAVLRAVGLDAQRPVPVTGDWLNLFEPGTDLAPLNLDGAGSAVPGINLPAGSVIHPVGSPEEERYLLRADGSLAPLGPVAYRLFLLGNAGSLGEAVARPPADLAALRNAEAAGGSDWPTRLLTPLAEAERTLPCATLGEGTIRGTMLAESTIRTQSGSEERVVNTVSVARGGGALVRGGTAGSVTVIDSTGIAYAVPGATEDVVIQLGYTSEDISVVPAPWLRLIPSGPELTAVAAASTPAAAG
ncbi:type VII secretion protein EccB [Mycetocola spongiae]|uniref:type VII secretion protein EccB n=1 Tax=Mycetocola spongiae TaxID=2859226 RepID=UPI001CF34C2D|nr:type VII secretion protein EccB [Mycetocola spongiae]UCR90380.1 type VII secretion protein EccB [Mycetocola spongiae]